MKPTDGNLFKLGKRTKWLSLVAVGALALGGGVLLPQLLPSAASHAASTSVTTKTGKEDKKSLEYAPPTWPEAPDPRTMFMRLGVCTILVLGLCVATIWVGQKWLRGQGPRPSPSGQMQVVETLHLSRGCQLHLVKVGTQLVLVGMDRGGLATMTPLPEPFDKALFEAEPELATDASAA